MSTYSYTQTQTHTHTHTHTYTHRYTTHYKHTNIHLNQMDVRSEILYQKIDPESVSSGKKHTRWMRKILTGPFIPDNTRYTTLAHIHTHHTHTHAYNTLTHIYPPPTHTRHTRHTHHTHIAHIPHTRKYSLPHRHIHIF